MKIIFSRKGFDTANGRRPSPIFPDGRMVSLPIPDPLSQITYGDISFEEMNLGALASDLTNGRISAQDYAHLDPDLNVNSIPRQEGWCPLFGQTNAAQGHLENQGVGVGDLFLFFGLYREATQVNGQYTWVRGSTMKHVIWGWMQVDHVLPINGQAPFLDWASYHPHYQRPNEPNNSLYLSAPQLTLGGNQIHQEGAGVFSAFNHSRQLTVPEVRTPSLWRLPNWFYPEVGPRRLWPLSYHSDMDRWTLEGDHVKLQTVGIGQEFVLDSNFYPEAIDWVSGLFGLNHP
jgi:hypothetical protein